MVQGEDVEGGDAEQLDGGGVGHDVGEFYGHIINRRRCMTQKKTLGIQFLEIGSCVVPSKGR